MRLLSDVIDSLHDWWFRYEPDWPGNRWEGLLLTSKMLSILKQKGQVETTRSLKTGAKVRVVWIYTGPSYSSKVKWFPGQSCTSSSLLAYNQFKIPRVLRTTDGKVSDPDGPVELLLTDGRNPQFTFPVIRAHIGDSGYLQIDEVEYCRSQPRPRPTFT